MDAVLTATRADEKAEAAHARLDKINGHVLAMGIALNDVRVEMAKIAVKVAAIVAIAAAIMTAILSLVMLIAADKVG